jgi:guanylate kinase
MARVKSHGIICILSSPSGAGKTTIARAIQAQDLNAQLSISYTTRPIRENEIDGKDYHFINHDTFLDMVSRGEFLEYAIIYDNLYGTPKDSILKLIHSGIDVIFDVDWQGANAITKAYAEHVVSIFVLPPSLDVLRARLESRNSENGDAISKRLQEAIKEISHYLEYDFIVVNDFLDDAIDKVQHILYSERLRRKRIMDLPKFIESL